MITNSLQIKEDLNNKNPNELIKILKSDLEKALKSGNPVLEDLILSHKERIEILENNFCGHHELVARL